MKIEDAIEWAKEKADSWRAALKAVDVYTADERKVFNDCIAALDALVAAAEAGRCMPESMQGDEGEAGIYWNNSKARGSLTLYPSGRFGFFAKTPDGREGYGAEGFNLLADDLLPPAPEV